MLFRMSSSRYFSKLFPIIFINGHCALLLKKCAQILRTARLSEAGSRSVCWSDSSSSKSTTSYASSTMHRTQCKILSSLSVHFLLEKARD